METVLVRSALYQSTKRIDLGSCCFRQPLAKSHCRFLHGYHLRARFIFGCHKLDENGWVVDFGGLGKLKLSLRRKFDHKTVIASHDPELAIFKELDAKQIIDLRVANRVGVEAFAEYCFEMANDFVKDLTNNRCWTQSCEVSEHEQNSAVVCRPSIDKV